MKQLLKAEDFTKTIAQLAERIAAQEKDPSIALFGIGVTTLWRRRKRYGI